jgi:5'-3' exonuclease
MGRPPEKMIDLQALTGDSVDNVPGIPGIGPKTAAQLIEEFGDLDTLLERASEIKQTKRRENIIEFADKARISRELVRLKDDVDVTENRPRRAGAQPTRRTQACCLPQGHGVHLADTACGRSNRDRCQCDRRGRSGRGRRG